MRRYDFELDTSSLDAFLERLVNETKGKSGNIMPHKQGYSKATIAYNIRHMIAAGHPRKQAIAAAYSTARRVASKRGVRPKHLR